MSDCRSEGVSEVYVQLGEFDTLKHSYAMSQPQVVAENNRQLETKQTVRNRWPPR